MEYVDKLYLPRSNFDSIQNSFITVFQILIGEKWNEVFYDCIKGIGYFGASCYFITLLFIINIITMNLFLAMLLGNFDLASLKNSIIQLETKYSRLVPNQDKSNVSVQEPFTFHLATF